MMQKKYFVLLWTLALLSFLLVSVLLEFDGDSHGTRSRPSQDDPVATRLLVDTSTCRNIPDDGCVVVAGARPLPTEGNPVPVRLLVDTSTCSIPQLDPMDPTVVRFVKTEPPLDCGGGREPPVVSNRTAVWTRDPALVKCCLQRLQRDGDDDLYRYSDHCTEFPPDGVSVLGEGTHAEFVRVRCDNSKDEEVRDFHAFVPLKPAVEQRCRRRRREREPNVSVLLLGLDSVSRLNFYRQMPRTLQLLRRLGAVEMLGYNKVGDNTFPNLVPVLSGLSEAELRDRCWPDQYAVFDKCPFLWKNFSHAGYRTMFMEDIPYIGIFNFEKPGFKKQPTDYYLRPFMKALDQEIGHHGLETSNRCAGSRLQVEVILDYVKKFVTTFNNSLYWGLVWSTSISHDRLNSPQQVDPLFSSVLEDMYAKQLLNNTVLVFLSDHGIRNGKIRETYQGRLEERLPCLYFVFPDWFQRRYSAAVDVLKVNARRLTSPYDLHETLVDLLHLPELETRVRSQLGRGMSLLGPAPVPEERTCEQAGISAHWCTCHAPTRLEADSSKAQRVAVALVAYINELLETYRPQCAQLRLERVVEARALQRPDALGTHKLVDYLVTVQTSPGGALFEATVGHGSGKFYAHSKDISRINLYGNQSACIDDYHMKLFCYCEDAFR